MKPYFREWSDLGPTAGKAWTAPSMLLRAERAGFFPNLQGRTLERGAGAHVVDTTAVLGGKISVVSVYSGTWAARQAASFVDGHGGLREALVGSAQRVDINVEENALRAGLVSLFLGGLRRAVERERWGRYFLLRRGLDDRIRGALGMGNGKVGYVFLVDWDCRVRWAGCGRAEEAERVSLIRGVRRLVDEWTKKHRAEAIPIKRPLTGKT